MKSISLKPLTRRAGKPGQVSGKDQQRTTIRSGSAGDAAGPVRTHPKVCLASSSYADGGAAIAASRLHTQLARNGMDSRMVVKRMGGHPQKVYMESSPVSEFVKKIVPGLARRLLKRIQYPNHALFSVNWQPLRFREFSVPATSELLHVHWVADGFLTPELWKNLAVPVVLTMHDMWPFTGGCHYTSGCTGYTGNCSACPQLHSPWEHFLASWVWQRKKAGYEKARPTVISPSRWLATQAARSELLGGCDIRVIPNVIDLEVFSPSNRLRARKELGLPLHKQLLLFGAQNPTSDPRKGFSILNRALSKIRQTGDFPDLELVVFGAVQKPNEWEIPFPTHWVGTLESDIDLARMYSASDLFVTPSREDNLPNTIIEATACGVPVVGFNVGGIPEMIRHQQSGYVAEPTSDDLANGILYCLQSPRLEEMGRIAREFATSKYGYGAVKSHIDLYDECVYKHN